MNLTALLQQFTTVQNLTENRQYGSQTVPQVDKWVAAFWGVVCQGEKPGRGGERLTVTG
jgi:hypothetical protein